MEESREAPSRGPIHGLPMNLDGGREIQIQEWPEALGYLLDLVNSKQMVVVRIGNPTEASGLEVPGQLYYDGHKEFPRWVKGTDTGSGRSGHAFRIGEPLAVGSTQEHNTIWFADGEFTRGELLTQDGDDYFYLRLDLTPLTIVLHELI